MKRQTQQGRHKISRKQSCSVWASVKKCLSDWFAFRGQVVLLVPTSASPSHLKSILLRGAKLHQQGYQVQVMQEPSKSNNTQTPSNGDWFLMIQEYLSSHTPETTDCEAKYNAYLPSVLPMPVKIQVCFEHPYALMAKVESSPTAGGGSGGAQPKGTK